MSGRASGTLTRTHETTHLGQIRQVYAVDGDELRFALPTSPTGATGRSSSARSTGAARADA